MKQILRAFFLTISVLMLKPKNERQHLYKTVFSNLVNEKLIFSSFFFKEKKNETKERAFIKKKNARDTE